MATLSTIVLVTEYLNQALVSITPSRDQLFRTAAFL